MGKDKKQGAKQAVGEVPEIDQDDIEHAEIVAEEQPSPVPGQNAQEAGSAESKVASAHIIYCEDGVKLTARVKGKPLFNFFRTNARTESRYRGLYLKEPETIDWLNEIKPGEVLWDIGANVGIYSIYAGVIRKALVWAFEPLFSNYYVLNKNIEVNHLSTTVKAFCLAFSDHNGISVLNSQATEDGIAQTSFDDNIMDSGEHFVPRFKQGMIGYTIDEFVERYNPRFPKHIKLDVDGLEDKIVIGAEKTLLDQRLQRISIEMHTSRVEMVEFVKGKLAVAGFELVRCDRTSPLYPNSLVRNFQFARAGSVVEPVTGEQHA